MKLEIFNEFLELEWQKIQKIMGFKNREYARGGDKLSNFKAASRFRSKAPETMCFEYCTKHLVSLSDLVNDLEQNIHHPLALWSEKCTDAINYILLLNALLCERYEDNEQYNHIE